MFFQKIFERLLKIINVPPLAIKMFKLSNDISGINKSVLPTELIPLNSIELSRGLLNFTMIQNRVGWKLPYWAVQQYNPNSKSFIPRSHLALSINITHRNWTAVGSMECDIEPIIDPRGSATPFRNGWSIEFWVKKGDELFLPAYQDSVEQILINDLPVVKTKFTNAEFILEITSYVFDLKFIHEAEIINLTRNTIQLDLIAAIRPFNPEGISPIENIQISKETNSLIVNKKEKIIFSQVPFKTILSDFAKGDCANLLGENQVGMDKMNCDYGFANAAAIFPKTIASKNSEKLICVIPLDEQKKYLSIENKPSQKVIDEWENILNDKTVIETPDKKLNSLIKSSLSSLLLLCDKNIITPGPTVYHQFWFRDAAYQLNALDKFGFHDVVKKIVLNFPSYQKKDGYFQSQKGEWDSNGQAVWTVLQHCLLSNDKKSLENLYDNLMTGIKWINKKRIKGKNFVSDYFYGLLPKGISAEHLGLADFYYWDNFWSLAGIRSLIFAGHIMNNNEDINYLLKFLREYENIILKSVKENTVKNNFNVLPAAPNREPDCGMIGSISALYPLNLFPKVNEIFEQSLEFIHDNFFHKNLFFQQIIHSGGNPYITLQIAHSYLIAGEREKCFKIFSDVMAYASSTNNYPEAIHPLTNGGVMGDGHHGWASAEVLLLVRDLFIYEGYYYQNDLIEINLLRGIPKNWFTTNQKFRIEKAPLLCGKISIGVSIQNDLLKVKIDYASNVIYKQEMFKLFLPLKVEFDSTKYKELISYQDKDETVILMKKISEEFNFRIIEKF